MGFRLSRLRFIVVRACIISFIIILYLQFVDIFTSDNSHSHDSDEFLTPTQFWKKLSNEDKELTDKQRIKQIELIEKQTKKIDLNWTNIFFDSYSRKLSKLNERNIKTTYKYQFKENQNNISQNTFQIFEETPVSLCHIKRYYT